MRKAHGIIHTCPSLVSPLNNVIGSHKIENQRRREETQREKRLNCNAWNKSNLVLQLQSYKFHIPNDKSSVDGTTTMGELNAPPIIGKVFAQRDRFSLPGLPRPPGGTRMFTPKEAVGIILSAESSNFSALEVSNLKDRMIEWG